MKFKDLSLSLLLVFSTVLLASEFTVVKSDSVNQVTKISVKPNSAKKIKELSLEQMHKLIRNLLVDLDLLSMQLRVYLLDQFELALAGDAQTVINSSSKSERAAYFELLQEIEQDLALATSNLQLKLKKLKLLNSKAEKLKGS